MGGEGGRLGGLGAEGGKNGGGKAGGGDGGGGDGIPLVQLARMPAALQMRVVFTSTVLIPMTGGLAPALSRIVTLSVDVSSHAPL